MYVDEIKAQAMLPELGSCAGVGRDLFGGIGPRQEPGTALQSVFVQVGSASKELTDGGGVEPYFDIADDLYVGVKGCRTVEESAGECVFERDIRRNGPIDRSELSLLERRN